MIKASGTTQGGRKLLVIGLSRANIEKLLDNQPLRFNATELGLEADVLILGGETEDDIVDDLRALGM